MAERTDCLLTRDLMFDAVPFDELVLSVAVVAAGVATYVFFSQHLCGARNLILWSYDMSALRLCEVQACHRYLRIMREIMEVPFPRAASRRLMSFLTFHISMFASCSAFALSWSDMMANVVVEISLGRCCW